MQMEANEALTGPRLVSLPRKERERVRPEDFEMIERTRAALALLDSKWSVDIIILLASGMHRHARLVDNIPGLSKKVLTATLRKLERSGIVSRQVYPEIPVRVEYSLTPLGWQLTEPLMALYEWAVAHESELAASQQRVNDVQRFGRPALTLAPVPAA
jgi:DNA-binding HxlR family transcriptional regulator